jgi:hypothetical protein
VVEVVELVELLFLLIISTGASPFPDQCAKTDHVIRLTFPIRKGTVTLSNLLLSKDRRSARSLLRGKLIVDSILNLA